MARGLTVGDPPRIRVIARNKGENAIAVLRVFARKPVGEPLTTEEQEAAREALRLLERPW
jgi:hypothetical protein